MPATTITNVLPFSSLIAAIDAYKAERGEPADTLALLDRLKRSNRVAVAWPKYCAQPGIIKLGLALAQSELICAICRAYDTARHIKELPATVNQQAAEYSRLASAASELAEYFEKAEHR